MNNMQDRIDPINVSLFNLNYKLVCVLSIMIALILLVPIPLKDAVAEENELFNRVLAVDPETLCTEGLESGIIAITFEKSKCDVLYDYWDIDWIQHVKSLLLRSRHIAGLKADGTVFYDGYEIEDWQNIVAVSVGTTHTVGLKSNGTVISVGTNT